MLTLQPEILQAMVSGDKRPYIVGLIVPDPEWTLDWCRAQDIKCDFADLNDNPQYRSALRAAVDRVNADLSVTEKVRQFELTDEPFTIENGEMTPSMKIRRHVIRERYAARVNGMYKD
jgi:long-chain acyl-CoA synthetase